MVPIVPRVKRLGKPGLSLVLLIAAGACSGPPPAQPEKQTTPAAPAGAAAHANESEAAAHAEALLEDFKRREAAQAKFDRENPATRTNPIPASLPVTRSTPSIPAPPASTEAPAAQPAPAPAAPVASGHDEAWWKEQRRSLQQVLDDALAKLAEAEKNNLKYGYNDAQAIYKKQVAAVAAARQAIDQLHDDARRAGVPPAWLR